MVGATLCAGLQMRMPLVAAQQAGDSAVAEKRGTVVDEVVWVVGDEPILKSDIEVTRLQGNLDGHNWGEDADCRIPEQIAVQKLFLAQAAIDSLEVSESEIAQGIDQRINMWISDPSVGSRERLEQIQRKSISQIRQDMHDEYKNLLLTQRMQAKLVEGIKVSPAEVRNYFRDLPADSFPMVPTTVEVEIITQQPRVAPEEVARVKDLLREYTDRVTKGETSFATLARLYSEDKGSARMGGELGYMGRGMLDPAFAAVAFNLTDPNKISKIVESEFGYHIIQLIDKRGDKVKVRHILRKPVVSDSAINATLLQLDTIATAIRKEQMPDVLKGFFTGDRFTFEDGVSFFSDDKDTRNNRGLMANTTESGQTSRFRLQDLPAEVARTVDTLQVGQISQPFTMINSRGKTVCIIAKLKSRTEGHKATVTEDFQVMKEVVMQKRREKKLHDWVVNKIKSTYVRIGDEYKDCQFEYEGWIR